MVHREAYWRKMVLYLMDTAVGLPLSRVGNRDNAPEDTSPRMVLLQDRSFVLGKATVLETVLTQGNPRVGEPSQGNLPLEVQHPERFRAGVEVAHRGGDS